MSRAHEILQHVFGYPAFRGEQEAIVEHLAAGGDALVLMPTGGGKSLCYQIPGLMREGTAVVVSPLIALMQDQVSALKEAGVAAAYLNSSLDAETAWQIERDLIAGRLDIVTSRPSGWSICAPWRCSTGSSRTAGWACSRSTKPTA